MNDRTIQREALVEAVLTRFFEHYTVIIVQNGHYLKLPLFVQRDGSDSPFHLNPAIPDAFFRNPPKLKGCPCCGWTGKGGRARR